MFDAHEQLTHDAGEVLSIAAAVALEPGNGWRTLSFGDGVKGKGAGEGPRTHRVGHRCGLHSN